MSGTSTERCTSSTCWSTATSTVGTLRPSTRASSMSKSVIARRLRNDGAKRKLSARQHRDREQVERGALLGAGSARAARGRCRVIRMQREAADVLRRLLRAVLHLEQAAIEIAAQERVMLAVLERARLGDLPQLAAELQLPLGVTRADRCRGRTCSRADRGRCSRAHRPP
jgi:hypothetical protein